jgi:hypothetical protein
MATFVSKTRSHCCSEPSRDSPSFAFLRCIRFIVQRPFHRVTSLLEFNKWRKILRFLLGNDHRSDQLASPLADYLTKRPQIREVIIFHLQLPIYVL